MKISGDKNVTMKGLCILLVFVAFFAGAFYRVQVPRNVIEPFAYFGIGWGIVMTILYIYSYFTSQKLREYTSSKVKYPKLVLVGSVFVIPLLCQLTFANGLIALGHIFTSSEGAKTFVISNKSSTYYSRRCKGRVSFEGYKFFLNGSYCLENKLLWESLKVGSSIRTEGTTSPFGFHISRVRS